jgi:hypothetical protein
LASAVGVVLSNWVEVHASRSARHAVRSLVALNEVPAAQAVQVRSRVLPPLADMPSPATHVLFVVQLVRRCSEALWKVFAGHAVHVRAAVVLSAKISSPAAQKVCAVQDISRWSVTSRYVLAPQAEQVRAVVKVSADIL